MIFTRENGLPDGIPELRQGLVVIRVEDVGFCYIYDHPCIEATAAKHDGRPYMRILIHYTFCPSCEVVSIMSNSAEIGPAPRAHECMYRVVLGLSRVQAISILSAKERDITYLLASVMHNLVVGSSVDLPILRQRGMWL